MNVTHFYRPEEGHRLRHEPLKAIIAPRPIGWISTIDPDGHVNLAPYSFFNGICERPPMLMFAGTAGKDSIANAEATGEFVFNMVTRQFAEAMNITCIAAPHGIDEMVLAQLPPAPSVTVKPPRVSGIAAAIECKVVHIHRIKDLSGNVLNHSIVMGQATGVHIDPQFLSDGLFDTAAARPIARCGYRGDYVEVAELFEMLRPDEERTAALLNARAMA